LYRVVRRTRADVMPPHDDAIGLHTLANTQVPCVRGEAALLHHPPLPLTRASQSLLNGVVQRLAQHVHVVYLLQLGKALGRIPTYQVQ
jgi:hypothetical protein